MSPVEGPTVRISHETPQETRKRLRRVLAEAALKVLPGQWAVRRGRTDTSARPHAEGARSPGRPHVVAAPHFFRSDSSSSRILSAAV
ncbi:DUF6196 family protein [Streptomyces sp. 3N207]|uniref:DUF6196 family protein n=1 Tax=Streptomyces sp. 3N207 TaxID=3457417 RepID=UPI003FD14F42